MQTEEAVKEVEPKTLEDILRIIDVQNAPELVIKLVDESETNWTKEGTENDQFPERLSMPSVYRVLPVCQVALPDKNKKYTLKTIRYIAGCQSLDPVYQDENGYKPDVNQDNIWLTYGTLTINRVGSDVAKYDYLKLYQGNVNNPYRPETADDEFEEIIEQEVAEKDNISTERKFEAYDLIRGLRQQTTEGYDYDESKIKLFSSIFGLNSYPSSEEKFRELIRIADENPDHIINSIVNHKKGTYATVEQAINLGVIALHDDKAVLTASNTVILPFKTKYNPVTQRNKLVDFLISTDGDVFNKQILIKVKEASENIN